MRRWIQAFILAVEFLSIIRWRHDAKVDGPSLGASLAWFPVVGLVIGSCLAALAWAAARVLPPAVVPAVVLTGMAIVTGALHLDGLADSADGVFGGHTPAQRLAIMRDSRIGTFGVVAVVLALLLMYAALLSLHGWALFGSLLAVPALGRLAMVIAVAASPYARPEGLGRLYRAYLQRRSVITALLSALAIALLVFGVAGLALVLATVLAASAGAAFAARRLGGLTGDVYGAIGVLTEVIVFAGASGLAERGWLHSPWR
jgi:adenosylcobinamide-GDP ribazoletransferase